MYRMHVGMMNLGKDYTVPFILLFSVLIVHGNKDLTFY
jgi:hypothetical protein